MRKPEEDTGESPNQELPPIGCGQLATPGPRKRGPSRVFVALLKRLGERLLPQSSYDFPLWFFPINTSFNRAKRSED